MRSLLNTWKGTIEYEGSSYEDPEQFKKASIAKDKPFRIVLIPKQLKGQKLPTEKVTGGNKVESEVVITVKQYMTRKATPEFDFMAKWNNDNPMPLRTMIGKKIKETPGMVYMELHGDILTEKTLHCMKCGKKISNPVSQYFGMGPECGGHNYVNPFNTEEELHQAVQEYRKELQNMTWEGWIIKSAITEMKEVER